MFSEANWFKKIILNIYKFKYLEVVCLIQTFFNFRKLLKNFQMRDN